jgi:NADH dehydrogenase FAD-containing subunit
LTVINKKVEAVEPEEITLTAKDRCDSCGAQAFVYAKGLSGDLYFCGHHYNKNKNQIMKWAFTIVDDRDLINSKPDLSN